MPTRFVGIHLSLAVIVALFGLSFVADPCGGGGDLCLGGAIGLFALGIAAFGGVGLFVWQVGRRASPLLVWDSALVALAGFILVSGASNALSPLQLAAVLVALLGLGGAVVAGRAVAIHRIERLLVIGALAVSVVLLREGGIPFLVVGLLALLVGWRLAGHGAGDAA